MSKPQAESGDTGMSDSAGGREYLIRCSKHNGDWDHHVFSSHVCHPESLPWEPVDCAEGDVAINVQGTLFVFIREMFGAQVIIEGDMSKEDVERVIQEIMSRMEAAQGAPGFLIDMTNPGGPVALDYYP